MKKNEKKDRLSIKQKSVFVLALVALFGLAHYFNLSELLKRALEIIPGLGPLGFLLFILVYILSSVLLIPGSILTIGAGAIFGLVNGSILVCVAATLGATVAFLIGRYLARSWVEKQIRGKKMFKAIDEAVASEGFKIVGLTRLSPIFPFNLLNYAYGVTSVSLKDYFFASLIGMIPGTVMYVYIGSLAGDLATAGVGGRAAPSAIQWGIRIAGFLATMGVTLYVTKIARRALAKEISQTDPCCLTRKST